MDSWAAVATLVLAMNVSDLGCERIIGTCSVGDIGVPPTVVAAPRDFQDATGKRNRKTGSLRVN
jgi:purine nucleoside phosphorylase